MNLLAVRDELRRTRTRGRRASRRFHLVCDGLEDRTVLSAAMVSHIAAAASVATEHAHASDKAPGHHPPWW